MSIPSLFDDVPQVQRENESVLPRRYQEEIFSRAQKGNVIAAMDTGSGKTLISLLLIKWIASQERSRGKTMVFLVPKVALVEQQHSYIEKHSSLRVVKLHGQQELDLSDRTGWRNRLSNCEVLVMTAQIFLNILTHSLWSLDKVSLLIFDECHHARKNHPYNGIMREYFHVPVHLRPKIFGMTASPIWNIRDPVGSLALLEKNLDAKVTAVRDHVQELSTHSPKAEELIKVYSHPPEQYNYPSPTIYQCLQVIDDLAWSQMDVPWSSIPLRYEVTLNDLGPYCASLFLYQEIRYYITKIIEECNQNMTDGLDNILEGILPFSNSSSRTLPTDIHLVIDILLDFEPIFHVETPHSNPTVVSLDWCTPKVKLLVNILTDYHAHTPAFQCLIFVEQRQIASSLSRALQALPELQGIIKCAFLTGQGVNSEGVSKQTDRSFGDPVKLFRERELNILIATSVAEEGLDFQVDNTQQCDLVVRFDPLHHMVGYVQSRGRARKTGSTFVVMVAEDDTSRLQKYQALKQKESEVNHVYRTRHLMVDDEEVESDDADEMDASDMRARERYVVKSTGAVLSYDNALQLLNHLCSLIPRDTFTKAHMPIYTGDFEVTVQLPRALPLSPQHLVFSGPIRSSKQEAKRAAAFRAVKRLREIDVFDEYLLPMAKNEEYDGSRKKPRHKGKKSEIPVVMTVPVHDPWCMGQKLWLHPITIDGPPIAGLVTGTSLCPEDFAIDGCKVMTLPAIVLPFEGHLEYEQRKAMDHFTRLCIWYNITSSPISGPLSLYLVPITADYFPDFMAIAQLLDNPRGQSDWTTISENCYDQILILSRNHWGRTYHLRKIRDDLSPMSSPLPGSREATESTYRDYWLKKWTGKKRTAIVGCDGPILETSFLARSTMGTYTLETGLDQSHPVQFAPNGELLPQNACLWIPMKRTLRQAFKILPVLCHRMTNAHREQSARYQLGLHNIPKNLIIEAFTIPSANMPFNNQRLETLGDAVLQLCTTVHLLNKYPNRHEGQLSNMRQSYVQNKFLLFRALELGLDKFVNSEIPSVYKWRYVVADDTAGDEFRPKRLVSREYSRRSMQDCMEAILGASFVAGGIPLSLQTGTALGLEFGGPLPWVIRYRRSISPTPIAPLFAGLEKNLGYQFRHNDLLLESLCHPSFTNSEVPSYQRLEFLGDAILDLVVIEYLYRKFPNATSHELALPRTKAICAPSLANIAVRRLGLQKMILYNNIGLSIAIERYTTILETVSGADIVKTGWKFDPPKALSDIFESVIGAVLVDSGYNYDKTASVVEYVMSDVLEALSPTVAKDPVSELLEWMAGSGCRQVAFEKRLKKTGIVEREGTAVVVHGIVVAGPIVSMSPNISKFAVAERALTILKDGTSEKALSVLCDCAMAMSVGANINQRSTSDSDDEEEVVDILTHFM